MVYSWKCSQVTVFVAIFISAPFLKGIFSGIYFLSIHQLFHLYFSFPIDLTSIVWWTSVVRLTISRLGKYVIFFNSLAALKVISLSLVSWNAIGCVHVRFIFIPVGINFISCTCGLLFLFDPRWFSDVSFEVIPVGSVPSSFFLELLTLLLLVSSVFLHLPSTWFISTSLYSGFRIIQSSSSLTLLSAFTPST